MPLVVPGITSAGSGDKKTEWENKLVGKKLSDSASDETSFAKSDLPKEHRVVEEGSMYTTDVKPDRLNIHVGNDGIIRRVEFK